MKTDDPLAAVLSGLQVPPPSPAARERALHRATIALRQSPAGTDDSASEPHHYTRRRFAITWSLAATLAMLFAFAVIAFWHFEKLRQIEALNTQSIDMDRTVLAQIEALFGSQLNAVVEHAGSAPDIRLAEDAMDGGNEGGHSQPVVVEFTRGADTIRVLGYSGRAVCVDLAGHRTCFEPLETGDGQVILAGKGFCWTPQNRATQLSGYRVATKLLSRS
jgi:hypothetical protein